MIDLTRDGDVFVLRMDNGENRFSPEMLGALEAALDEIRDAEGPRALVTTGTGKFFSNGLDLDWLSTHGGELVAYLTRVNGLFARVLSLPCPTVSACNGHAFGAGAMLSIAHDHRIMRADRGYWCLPEADLRMMFPGGMNELVAARLPALTAHEAMLTSRRYGGAEAVSAGIADRAAVADAVLPEAIELARSFTAHAGWHLATIRTDLYAGVMAALTTPPPNVSLP